MDYGIIQFTDKIAFGNAELVSVNPNIIRLTGEDFNAARSVLVNGQECPRIEVVSTGTLLAELPGVNEVRDIAVISSAPTRTAASTDVSLGALIRPAKISGLSALVQRVLKVLLTTAGTDVLGGTTGGGVLAMAGTLNGDTGGLVADISAMMRAVSDDLIADPNGRLLPPAEQLGELNLLSAEWDRESQKVSLQIEIINVLGEKSISQFGA